MDGEIISFLSKSDICTYINTKMFVCLFVHVFLGHFETDWGTLWYKVAFYSGKGSKTKILNKKQIFKNLRNLFLDNHLRNVMANFRCCRLNDVATIEKTHIHTYIQTDITKNLTTFWRSFSCEILSVDLCAKRFHSYFL